MDERQQRNGRGAERPPALTFWQRLILGVYRALTGKTLDLRKQALEKEVPRERGQQARKQTRYSYSNGPMYYLGQQIVRAMQDAGYPAHIWQCLRSAEKQQEYYLEGTSRARPFQSPHQYYEAVDILHPALMWKVGDDYWEALSACVEIVEEKFGVELVHGWRDWGWDGAHIQLKDWKRFRLKVGMQHPNQRQLRERFEEVLPKVWARYRLSGEGSKTFRSTEDADLQDQVRQAERPDGR